VSKQFLAARNCPVKVGLAVFGTIRPKILNIVMFTPKGISLPERRVLTYFV